MVKNRYPLPLISEMLDLVCQVRILTKLDLLGASNFIRIEEADEYNTASPMSYS